MTSETPVDIYEKIKSVLSSRNILVSTYEPINYGIQFDVSKSDWSGKMRIYQNKKGNLKIDYSQIKGNNAQIIKNYIDNGLNLNINCTMDLGYPIIGTDESGKGDYFGPLVSAGIYVDEESARKLIACGVKDSKQLSDSKNLELADNIKNMCKGCYAIIEISPEKYNILYGQLKKEQKNLNILLAWSHSKAIEEILIGNVCKKAIIDQFADERIIHLKLQERGRELDLVQRHKAEGNIAVAAASILARARYLERLSTLSSIYNITLPKGASDNTIKAAKLFIKMYGQESLSKVAKIHFKTTDKIFNEI